jgi:GNAT superfamily N-acetyltransferase
MTGVLSSSVSELSKQTTFPSSPGAFSSALAMQFQSMRGPAGSIQAPAVAPHSNKTDVSPPEHVPFNASHAQLKPIIGVQNESFPDSYPFMPEEYKQFMKTRESVNNRIGMWQPWLRHTENDSSRGMLETKQDKRTVAYAAYLTHFPKENPDTGRPWDKLDPPETWNIMGYAQQEGYNNPGMVIIPHVVPEYRRQGIGTSHIKRIVEIAKEQKTDGLFALVLDGSTSPTFAFAKAMGFNGTPVTGNTRMLTLTPDKPPQVFPYTMYVRDLRKEKPDGASQSGNSVTIDPQSRLHLNMSLKQ